MAQEEQQKSQKHYKKYYDKKAKSRCLEVGEQVLILFPTVSNKLIMQWRGPYIVKSRVGAKDYRIKLGSKAKTLKKYVSREPDVDVVHTSNNDDVAIAVAGVIYQDTDPELGEVPDLEGYHQKERARDIKLAEDLSEEKRHMLKT